VGLPKLFLRYWSSQILDQSSKQLDQSSQQLDQSSQQLDQSSKKPNQSSQKLYHSSKQHHQSSQQLQQSHQQHQQLKPTSTIIYNYPGRTFEFKILRKNFQICLCLRAIQIIPDTFLAYFRPPSPMCHFMTLARTPLPPIVMWHFDFPKKLAFFLRKSKQNSKIWFKIMVKCHVTIWLTAFLPFVAFGVTVR